uniref:EF-hand domain-containing protein n=1 Tax=Steinernema glaseri TaxID=37863 RepID=A0A1I7ZAJ4_9BILA
MDAADSERLFGICDRDSKGYLVQSDLYTVCPQLSKNEVDFIFSSLDPSKSGRIEKHEFCRGFLETLRKGERRDDNVDEEEEVYRSADDRRPMVLFVTHVKLILSLFSCRASRGSMSQASQKDVLRLYKELQTCGVPEMLYQFEKVLGSLCKEIKEQKDQNETLQQVYHQEREMHNRRMHEVENELDQQLSYAEEKARAEERQRLNKEKEEMRIRLEMEVEHLKSSIEKLHKVEELLNKERTTKRHLELEDKLQAGDLSVENRSLKSNLADNHLEIALIKAELAQVRSEFESKQAEFINEKENILAAMQQKENLERQLELLYDANKKLHDANDTLAVALDQRSSVCQQFNIRGASPSPFSLSRKSSLLSFNEARLCPNGRSSGCPSEGGCPPTAVDVEYEISLKSCSSEDFARPESVTAEVDTDNVGLSEPTGPPERTFRVVLCGDASVGKSSIIMRIVKGIYANGLPSTLGQISLNVALIFTVFIGVDFHGLSEPTGPPERTFRVVLCGDASVGKSSIIMRIVKGIYANGLPSTLGLIALNAALTFTVFIGVDFHVKSVRIDGKNVAVQLWDTAGQERFRSLCKSYFRRADGAVLVYNCAAENTFLRIREWIDVIRDSVTKPVPILLCANKTDLRDAVYKYDANTASFAMDTQFIECSALEGTNIENALVKLTRFYLRLRTILCVQFPVMNKLLLTALCLVLFPKVLCSEVEVDSSVFEYKLEEFLQNEFDYNSYLSRDVNVATVPFRDVNTDTFWKIGSVPRKQKELRRYIEKNLTRELRAIETKPWIPVDQILDELARCSHYEYGTVNKQHFVYDKELYGWMHIMKFSCVLVDDQYVKEIKKMSFGSGAGGEEHFDKESNALLLHNEGEDHPPGIPIYSLPPEAKAAMNNMFPLDDIVELSQNTKRDQFFRNVSIPLTIRLIRLSTREIPDVLDIIWKDLSPESQSSLEECATQLCEESDQVSELTDFNGAQPSDFFKDRALRYNLSPDTALLTYASSRPSFFGDSGQQSKSTTFRKLKKKIATETETEWYKLLDWQVAHNFHANIPDVLL